MSQETHDPNERLTIAVAEFKSTSVSREALDRGEDAILGRLPARAKPRRGFLLVAGLGTVAVAAVLLSLPAESFAAELQRIGKNGDTALHHLRQYEVTKDGTLRLVLESYAANGKTKIIYASGVQTYFFDGRYTTIYDDGATVVETRPDSGSPPKPDSASDILAKNATGPDVTVKVWRGLAWHGLKVDRFTVDRIVVDGRGDTLKLHMVLFADPTTERPLEMQAELTGFPKSVLKWDYPKSSPWFPELSIPNKDRLYDVNAERESILAALKQPGRKAVVDGVNVELLQLWVGEDGEACAVARAGYPYPSNYGIKIDNIDMKSGPEADTKSTKYFVPKPTMYDGRAVQLFYTYRPPNAGGVNYPDSVALKIPVFREGGFVGYAEFPNVKVNRAWSLRMLLQPLNVPFWTDSKTEGAPTANSG